MSRNLAGAGRRSGLLPVLSLIALIALIGATATMPVRAAETAPRGRDVTIIEGKDRTVYEYRQNGELRMIRIVPETGRPYYLVPADDTRGYGNLENADMLIPKWILLEF